MQCQSKIFFMLLIYLGTNEYVIQEYINKITEIFLIIPFIKNIMKIGAFVIPKESLETHNVHTLFKIYLFYVFFLDPHLVISQSQVHIEKIYFLLLAYEICNQLWARVFSFTHDFLNCLNSKHNLNVPSFFVTKMIGAPRVKNLVYVLFLQQFL